MRLNAFFDGSYSRNRAAAYGFIVKDEEGKVVYSGYGRVGRGVDMSSVVGEYEGLYQAMLYVHRNYPDAEAVFIGDSALVISQMNGESKARKGRYLPYYKKSIELATSYIENKLWTFQWIGRAFNSEADELSQYQSH